MPSFYLFGATGGLFKFLRRLATPFFFELLVLSMLISRPDMFFWTYGRGTLAVMLIFLSFIAGSTSLSSLIPELSVFSSSFDSTIRRRGGLMIFARAIALRFAILLYIFYFAS
jgi:hypothetical protein